jgi:patatin-related protein
MTAGSPQAEYTQEVRFAVVMYGGVSLAIYINGIAQELLRMVRSTSASRPDAQGNPNRTPVPAAELTGTERVYRRLSCLLSDPQLLKQFRKSLETPAAPATSGNTSAAKTPDIVDQRTADNIVNTRFVVDILSGTSAGGINAVYLAKALANDQNLNELKTLWVTEGDIGLLLNDKKSVADLHLTNQQPPQSLLNSRRMYFKLLNAFQGMEKSRKSVKGFVSPHVEELDLFITTTDLEGMLVPLRLSDTVVFERRHRNVFHFKYATPEATGTQRNDFLEGNDPFLAFAARCTSSFPFAFEPMRLSDINEVLDRFPEYGNKDARTKMIDQWQSFFKNYKNPLNGQQVDVDIRSFSDGGILDNKPFSYATDTLMRRDAPLAVDRKLIYIEPSPEHPEDEPPRTDKYQALENVKAAVLDLPSYETIREDLQRVIDRNELIKRVQRITAAVERDLDRTDKSIYKRPNIGADEWAKLDLAGMVERFGIYYIPYRRLRISSTTDELAKLIARFLDLNAESAQFTAVRHLIHAWRDQIYPDYHQDDGIRKFKTANQFLIDYDFKYWLRRITFVRNKIDQFYGLFRLPAREDGNGVDEREISAADATTLERLRLLKYHPLKYAELSADRKRKIQQVLVYLKCEFNEIYKNLRVAGRMIQSRPDENSDADHRQFAKAIESIKAILKPQDIEHLLGLPPREPNIHADDKQSIVTQQGFSQLDDNELTKRAKNLLFKEKEIQHLNTPDERIEVTPTDLGQKFVEAGEALAAVFEKHVVKEAWERGRGLLVADEIMEPDEKRPEPKSRCKDLVADSPDMASIREYLWRYFSQFDDYDQISFPILFGNEVGETDVVDLLRISPEDATSLINERAERYKPKGRTKLAGTALHHFGAFLDQVWRQNDILWGRLDGAERLITAMLPEPEDKKVRAQLISEAQGAILLEELTEKSDTALQGLIVEALVKMSAGMKVDAAVAQVLKPLQNDNLKTRLETVLRSGLENEGLLDFMKQSYEVNRNLETTMMLRAMSRSTQVIGKMFEDMADRHQMEGKRLAWIARLGQLFWGLVEVAVPGSMMNLFFFHWLKIVYAFEVFLIVGSILVNASPDVTKFGWTILALTIALHVTVMLLGDYIRGRNKLLRFGLVLVVAAVLFLTTLGFGELAGWGWADTILNTWNGVTGWLRGLRP